MRQDGRHRSPAHERAHPAEIDLAPQLPDDDLQAMKAQLDLRKLAAETEKTELEKAQLAAALAANEAARADDFSRRRSDLELRRLVAEAEKIETEVADMKAEASDAAVRRTHEAAQRAQEAEKLVLDVKNARLSPLLEAAKAVVPAFGLVVSVGVAVLGYWSQQERDQATANNQRLLNFTKEITEGEAWSKPKFAILALLRSGGKEAAVTLIASMDGEAHDRTVYLALHNAVLTLYSDANLRPLILQEILTWAKTVGTRRFDTKAVDTSILERYLSLLTECLQRMKHDDAGLAARWRARSDQMVQDLKAQIGMKADDSLGIIRRIDAAYPGGGT